MAEARCPTCGRLFEPQSSPVMPFCSERCRLLDLGRWLDERYAVPCERDEEESKVESGESRAEEEE